jgi:hypothetical protein
MMDLSEYCSDREEVYEKFEHVKKGLESRKTINVFENLISDVSN